MSARNSALRGLDGPLREAEKQLALEERAEWRAETLQTPSANSLAQGN